MRARYNVDDNQNYILTCDSGVAGDREIRVESM